MGQPYDHYISRVHKRQWATNNRVTVLRRGMNTPKPLDVGKAIAAEQGLNSPSIERAYGRVESAYSQALPHLLDRLGTPTNQDWHAVRRYAVLMHDRYPTLRGSAKDEHGLPGGNAMMVPNPANWGNGLGPSDPLAQLATSMDRERLKESRLQLLGVNADLLPQLNQIFHGGPLLLGDAGIHAITLRPDVKTARTYVAMPLSHKALIVFGAEPLEVEEVQDIIPILNRLVAMESTVVIDTPDAPVINSFVAGMWKYQGHPSGHGVPGAVNVWSRIEDVSDTRS